MSGSSAKAARAARADAWDALSDPTRRRILASLGQDGRSVGEIASELPISRPAVSRHLRLLREAGLVSEEARGTRRLYRLQQAGAAAVQSYLLEVWGEAAARYRLTVDNLPARGGRRRGGGRRRT